MAKKPLPATIQQTREKVITDLLLMIGEDPRREGLRDTPARAIKAWEEWTSGYFQNPREILKQFRDGAEQAKGMIFQAEIAWYSHCEHHLAPFFGFAHIGYIPNGKIVGLSKLARLVDVFAKRLSVQERLTNQVASALHDELKCRGVGVVTQARHLCMESRGVNKVGTVTMCSALRGNFIQPEVRAEFMSLVQVAAAGVHKL